jgi:hypothetical protein
MTRFVNDFETHNKQKEEKTQEVGKRKSEKD